jgi:hypothetical protein
LHAAIRRLSHIPSKLLSHRFRVDEQRSNLSSVGFPASIPRASRTQNNCTDFFRKYKSDAYTNHLVQSV